MIKHLHETLHLDTYKTGHSDAGQNAQTSACWHKVQATWQRRHYLSNCSV